MNSYGKSSDEASPLPLSDEARSLAAVTVKPERPPSEYDATPSKFSELHSADLSLLIRDFIHRRSRSGLGVTLADLVGELSQYFLGLTNDRGTCFKELMAMPRVIKYHLRSLGALCFEGDKWFLLNNPLPDAPLVKRIQEGARSWIKLIEQPDRRPRRGARTMAPAGKRKTCETLGLPKWSCPSGTGPAEFLLAIVERLKGVCETIPSGDDVLALLRTDPARDKDLNLLVRDVLANSDGASLTLLVNQVLPYYLGLKTPHGNTYNTSLCPIEAVLQSLYAVGAKHVDGLWHLQGDSPLNAATVAATKASALSQQDSSRKQNEPSDLPSVRQPTFVAVESQDTVALFTEQHALAVGPGSEVEEHQQFEGELPIEERFTKRIMASKKKSPKQKPKEQEKIQHRLREPKRKKCKMKAAAPSPTPRVFAHHLYTPRKTSTSIRARSNVPAQGSCWELPSDACSLSAAEVVCVSSDSEREGNDTRTAGPLEESPPPPRSGLRLLVTEEQNVRNSAQYKQFVQLTLQERTVAALIQAVAERFRIDAQEVEDVSVIDSTNNVLVIVDLDEQVATLVPNTMLALRRKLR